MRPFFFFISPLEPRLGQTGFLLSSLYGKAVLHTHPFILVKVLSLYGVLCQVVSILAKAWSPVLSYQFGENSIPNAGLLLLAFISRTFPAFYVLFLILFQLFYYYCYHYFLPWGIFPDFLLISNAFEKYDSVIYPVCIFFFFKCSGLEYWAQSINSQIARNKKSHHLFRNIRNQHCNYSELLGKKEIKGKNNCLVIWEGMLQISKFWEAVWLDHTLSLCNCEVIALNYFLKATDQSTV